MRIKKIKNLLKKRKYFTIFFISFVLYLFLSAFLIYFFFNGFYLFFNYHIWYYPWVNIIFSIITGILLGINISLITYRFIEIRKYNNESGTGIFTSIISMFAAGCPVCSFSIMGLIIPGFSVAYSLAILPFKGLEIQIIGIFALIISILILTKSDVSETLLNPSS